MNTFNNNQELTSKGYNLHTNHPLQASAQEFLYYKKYVSIHSEDRDIIKYPTSDQFEIEIPEDLLNVASIKLTNWTFPSNYNTFSYLNSNISMTFKITKPYNPIENSYSDDLQIAIFNYLFLSQNVNYTISIEEGFYNPDQMATELTNKFNEAVSIRIINYLTENNADLVIPFKSSGEYSNFVIVYNVVNQKIWFGNRSDGFTLTNNTQFAKNNETQCSSRFNLPDYSNWGLPSNIGLTRNDSVSISKVGYSPRFYYGDVKYGDNGYWLVASGLPNSQVYYFECPNKINFMGPSYFYMELDGLNCIDETSPYNVSKFTLHTNETNGVCNSAFAKIAIPSTPISQWFDRDALPYKVFVPPAERIRKLKIALRYHDGQPVEFGVFNYSFMLEFTILQPQQLRKASIFGIPPNNYR